VAWAAPPRKASPHHRPAAAALPCGDYLSFQVLLDREGFSPGQIDGKPGINFTHALSAAQGARKLSATGKADCDTWKAFGGDKMEPAIVTYALTDADLKGPFEKRIPRKLDEQAKLPELGYESPLEAIAERFHASPALIQQMNRGVPMAAGRDIRVPGVQPFDPDVKPSSDPAAAGITVQVSREDSALRATRADGSVVFFAPVTTGSVHDPLPQGDFKVTGVSWHPVFHYNPDLFWDAKAGDTKATIKAGPNNPVGVVWIALSLEHYGLHGTPEPGNVGHTESHGCVRLTNWDAARVAALVKPGTPVLFR
ncbi:MAG TPA: L,D-transpeptidase, partial [Vicinamibacterales bacterium]|nr:L,D-transpeptidase [Vicinamibacterales bacterium]